MLSSIGMNKRQRKSIINKETLLLSFCGIFFGIIIGLILSRILIYTINNSLDNYLYEFAFQAPPHEIDFYIKIPILTLIFVIIIVYIIVFISNMLSIRKLCKLNPIDAIRNSEKFKPNKNELKTPKIIGFLFGEESIIGYKNIKKYKSKYKSILLSLTASIVLFLSITVIVDTFYNFSTSKFSRDNEFFFGDVSFQFFDKQKGYDLINYLENNNLLESYSFYSYDSEKKIKLIDKQISRDLKKLVDRKIYMQDTEDNMYLNSNLFCLYDEAYANILHRAGISELKDNEVIIMNTINQKSKYGNKIKISNLKIGDSYTIVTDEGEKLLKVVGIVDNFEPYYISNGDLLSPNLKQLVNENTFISLYHSHSYMLSIKTNNASEIDKRYNEIISLFDSDGAVAIFNNSLEASALENQKVTTETIISIFIIILSLVSAINVFNIIYSSLILRKKDFAILKSIGVSNKQTNKILALEGLFYGLDSLIYGISISVFLQFILYHLTTNSSLYGFHIPWKNILICIVFVYLVIFLAIIIAKKKLIKKNIIDEIRNENI